MGDRLKGKDGNPNFSLLCGELLALWATFYWQGLCPFVLLEGSIAVDEQKDFEFLSRKVGCL